MKLIVITRPEFSADEADKINLLFESGLQYLHLRKPGAAEVEAEQLLHQIKPCFWDRIVVTDFFGLALRYPLKGIHLNGRNSIIPDGFTGSISRSCHSFEEVEQYKSQCNYLFLSPIFDSISKQGYGAHFTTEQLQLARAAGIIDDKVVALGGISATRLPEVRRMGFGGAAMLGDVWQQPLPHLSTYFSELQNLLSE